MDRLQLYCRIILHLTVNALPNILRSTCGLDYVKCSPGEHEKCTAKNSQCGSKVGECICHHPKQDYPHCCYPSCGIDGRCVNGKCQCIGSGKYPNCEWACDKACKKGEQCVKVSL